MAAKFPAPKASRCAIQCTFLRVETSAHILAASLVRYHVILEAS